MAVFQHNINYVHDKYGINHVLGIC